MATTMEWTAEGWPPGFTWDEEAAAVLRSIDDAFGAVDCPEHFTNVEHCLECREHDEELKARPRMEFRRADLGNPGWDPITFTSPHGVAYLIPVLARYAMAPDFWPNEGWYGAELVFHLTRPDNQLLQYCNIAQRKAIVVMIGWISEHRTDDLVNYAMKDEWLSAFDIWQG